MYHEEKVKSKTISMRNIVFASRVMYIVLNSFYLNMKNAMKMKNLNTYKSLLIPPPPKKVNVLKI